MGEVVQLLQPLSEKTIVCALREIADAATEAVVLVTVSPDRIGFRSFGPDEKCVVALSAALDAMKK